MIEEPRLSQREELGFNRVERGELIVGEHVGRRRRQWGESCVRHNLLSYNVIDLHLLFVFVTKCKSACYQMLARPPLTKLCPGRA
jgi:hypothetical protein